MSKKVAVWAASMVAGLIAAYLIIAVLGIPAERFGTGFLIGTTFFIGLLALYFVVKYPAESADWAGTALDWISSTFKSLLDFFKQLVQ